MSFILFLITLTQEQHVSPGQLSFPLPAAIGDSWLFKPCENKCTLTPWYHSIAKIGFFSPEVEFSQEDSVTCRGAQNLREKSRQGFSVLIFSCVIQSQHRASGLHVGSRSGGVYVFCFFIAKFLADFLAVVDVVI